MSGGSSVEHIDAVDAFARNLYIRAKSSGAYFSDVAAAIRQLHIALRHLRVEAADQDSLLNLDRADISVYARELQPVVEDCEFTLQNLDALLEKYGEGRALDDDEVRKRRLAMIQTKLVNEKAHIDMFLDSVQLHNSANEHTHSIDQNERGMENIKDKVDEIARRLYKRRDINDLAEDENSLWREFKTELEKEGFSPQVLQKHKEILRAYIRELESMSNLNGGTCPTVRGLLEHESNAQPPRSSKAAFRDFDNAKYPAAIKDEHHLSSTAPVMIHNHLSGRRSPPSDSDSSQSGDSLALISTKDLLAMDRLNADMASMELRSLDSRPYSHSPPIGQKYDPTNGTLPVPGPPAAQLSSSPNHYSLGASPRSNAALPSYGASYRVPQPGTSPRPASHLAPDCQGHDIAADAEWTRIKRTLVSPEILERAGVRYEARPEFVAVLGRLSREQIADFARQSAQARAARSGSGSVPRKYKHHRLEREGSRSSRDDDDGESAVLDESDTTDVDDDKTSDKGTKSYPYIVNPPDKETNKTSPSSTAIPKPILKNRNENHVRFDPEPHELGKSPRSHKDDRDHYRDRHHDRDHDRDQDREHDRDQDREHDRDQDREHDRRKERTSPTSHRVRRESSSRTSDEDRYREDRYRGSRSRGDRHGDSFQYNDNGRRYHRDRGDRRSARKDDRSAKKKAWGETLGAVGIGGAAVSLISVLAEAASAM